MYRGMRVAVVIPAHNEARLLPVTLAGLPTFVDHVVVVDDGSTDATSHVARRRGPWTFEVIRHPHNRGVGGAIVTGYRRALAVGADATVVVGADAQMAPEEMPTLLDPIASGEAEYVKGDRLGHPAVLRRMPWVRFFGNHVLTRLTRWATGYAHIRDTQCGYTAISARALARLPFDAIYQRYGFPNDLLARLAEQDARVLDRPVTPIYGDETSGLRVLRVALPILWLLMRAAARRFARRPLGRRAPAAELAQ
jgi:glycosyltransferase involved in cell wall biosynthesis